MKSGLVAFLGIVGLWGFFAGCGKNEPETMGGEPGTPRTVATGAPAQAAKDSPVSNPRHGAAESEHAMSSFDREVKTNDTPPLPQASTTNLPSGKR